MEDLVQAILIPLLFLIGVYALASSVASGGRKSTRDSLSEAAEETKNSLPAWVWMLAIVGLLLLSGTIAR